MSRSGEQGREKPSYFHLDCTEVNTELLTTSPAYARSACWWVMASRSCRSACKHVSTTFLRTLHGTRRTNRVSETREHDLDDEIVSGRNKKVGHDSCELAFGRAYRRYKGRCLCAGWFINRQSSFLECSYSTSFVLKSSRVKQTPRSARCCLRAEGRVVQANG